MSSFADRLCNLTVDQARKLNDRARLTCEWELTSETEVNES